MGNPGYGLTNKHERAVAEMLSSAGVWFLKRGWPDFICIHNGDVVCIEVKPNGWQELKRAQDAVMRALSSKGIRCLRWDPDHGFTDMQGEPVSDLAIGGTHVAESATGRS